jgi:hypothetical protein
MIVAAMTNSAGVKRYHKEFAVGCLTAQNSCSKLRLFDLNRAYRAAATRTKPRGTAEGIAALRP